MAKKKKDEDSRAGSRGRGDKKSFEFFSVSFENADKGTIKRHLLFLVVASLLTKFIVAVATTTVFNTFLDSFDLQFYFDNAVKILHGQIPYIGYNFEYPVLIFVPILLALIPAVLLKSTYAFVLSFQIIMILCDLITLVCVYFISLKLHNENTAFLSGLFYATAFSSAYFVLTKYDAFPTCLLMLAVFFTLCGMSLKGYLATGLGFFAKIFPAIAFPFLILYNAKKSSLKEEITAVLKVMVPLSVFLLLPVIIVRPEAIRTYLFGTGANVGVYANTATFTLFSWLHGVGHTVISAETVSLAMYGMMGIAILYLLYTAYSDAEKRPVTLLKTLLCAFIAVIIFTKFHSPQYIVWFTPFLSLLVADDIIKGILFYIVQIFAYIEFPLMFGYFYTNLEYTNPLGSSAWFLTLAFFTLQYLALFILVFVIIRPKEGILTLFRPRLH